MKEHLENMSKFDENLKKEQERTKEALRLKLEERRKKRKQSEVEKPKMTESIRDDLLRGEMGTTQKLEALRQESFRRQEQRPQETEAASMQPRIEDGGMLLFL